MRYLPNKRDALQAHMHKVHKLGDAQTDTSYYTYYQNLIKNKSAHSKISNAFWSIPPRLQTNQERSAGLSARNPPDPH